MSIPGSFISPVGYSSSTCGYCSPAGQRSKTKSSKSYGFWANSLECQTYQDLIDRGWRRSGSYLYHPDMARTCCPQYTIRLDAAQFHPSRSSRQLLNRFNRFVLEDYRPGGSAGGNGGGGAAEAAAPAAAEWKSGKSESGEENSMLLDEFPQPSSSAAPRAQLSLPATPALADRSSINTAALPRPSDSAAAAAPTPSQPQPSKPKKTKGKNNVFELIPSIHAAEKAFLPEGTEVKHHFEIVLEPSSFTKEKYDLFRSYQINVHKESPTKQSESGFKRFLVDSPLDRVPIPYPSPPPAHLPTHFGSYHQLYRLDGKLIAMGVLDILPSAVSSVYLMYDVEYQHMGLGKTSALREAALAREMSEAGAGKLDLYMGFYIHTCVKMRYKADYAPSSLLNPATNTFYPYETCAPLLDAHTHASFSSPSHSNSPGPKPKPPPDSTSDWQDAVDPDEDEDDEEDGDVDSDLPSPPPPGFLDTRDLPKTALVKMLVLEQRENTVYPAIMSPAWRSLTTRREIKEIIAALGEDLCEKVVLYF